MTCNKHPVDSVLGEVVGMNKFSPQFLSSFFPFVAEFFKQQGTNNFNWEPVVHAYLASLKHSGLQVLPQHTHHQK